MEFLVFSSFARHEGQISYLRFTLLTNELVVGDIDILKTYS